MSFNYAEVHPGTGEVRSIVGIGEDDPLYAKSLLQNEDSIVVKLDQAQFELASTTTCYWDFADDKLVSVGTEPFEGAVFDFAARAWAEGRTLAQVQAVQWGQIKERRSIAEDTEYKWRGIPIDSDLTSRTVIMGALEMARLHPGFTIDFTTGDNREVELNQVDLQEILVGIATHVDVVHRKGRELRARIMAAKTPEQVKGVQWLED